VRHVFHAIQPRARSARIILIYKNFACNPLVSHIGLGVAARNTAAVLRQHGFWAEVWAVDNPNTLQKLIKDAQTQAQQNGEYPISHIVISALWVPSAIISALAMAFTDITFTVLSHSNVGFLQVEPNAIKLLREEFVLSHGLLNFRIAGACKRYTDWVPKAYGVNAYWLPNLYDLSTTPTRPAPATWRPGSILRIGCFGAIRPLKNTLSAAGAAVEVATRLNVDTEFWVSSGRVDGPVTVVNAVRQLLANIPKLTLKELPWCSWPEFRRVVASMNILMQPSYTESFNIVTADGVVEGIPSVVSAAIDWVPPHWQAEPDDVNDIADKTISLLHDAHAPHQGLQALKAHNQIGLNSWKDYLLKT
jgi:hypothetical protein